ncbi:hypothetical protein LINPERPRIM_LOCUS32800 [Linum perenne]
MEAIVPTVVK